MYHMTSIIEAVNTNIVLKKNVASIDINWEYIAVNQIRIFGLIIAIEKP